VSGGTTKVVIEAFGRLGPGTYSVKAAYSGDGTNAPSDSCDETFTIEAPVTLPSGTPDVTITPHGTGSLMLDCDLPRGDACTIDGTIDTGACTTGGGSDICAQSSGPGECTMSSAACTNHSRIRAAAAEAKPRTPARVVLATLGGRIPGGKKGRITVRVNAKCRALLHARHRLRERLTLTVKGKAGLKLTIDYAITLKG
jgi:hypothetical protein